MAIGKARYLSEEYLQKAGKVFSQLDGQPLFYRVGIMFWYDPLTSFGEGLLLDYELFYSFSQQLSFMRGVSWKK